MGLSARAIIEPVLQLPQRRPDNYRSDRHPLAGHILRQHRPRSLRPIARMSHQPMYGAIRTRRLTQMPGEVAASGVAQRW